MQLNTLDKQLYLDFHPNIVSSLAEVLEKNIFVCNPVLVQYIIFLLYVSIFPTVRIVKFLSHIGKIKIDSVFKFWEVRHLLTHACHHTIHNNHFASYYAVHINFS